MASTNVVSLNRFPIFALFSYRAAKIMGYSDEEAKVLGFSHALLYAIFKQGGTRGYPGKGLKKGSPSISREENPSKAASSQNSNVIKFGMQSFQVLLDSQGKISSVVVGGDRHDAPKYYRTVELKFLGDYHDKLAKAMDELLAQYSPDELNGPTLYALYKQGRDSCKHGVSYVDLDKLVTWCKSQKRVGTKA